MKEHLTSRRPCAKIKPPHLLGNQIVHLCPRHSAKSGNMLGFVSSHALWARGPCLLPWGLLSFEKLRDNSWCLCQEEHLFHQPSGMASSLSFLLLGSQVVGEAPGQQKGGDERCCGVSHVTLSPRPVASGVCHCPHCALFTSALVWETEQPGKGNKPIREKIVKVYVMRCVPCRWRGKKKGLVD